MTATYLVTQANCGKLFTMASIRLKCTNTCGHCGRSFHPYAKDQKYCCEECFAPHRSQGRRKRIGLVCTVCGKPFEVLTYRAATAHYCSRACWERRSPPENRVCPTCHGAFSTYQRSQVFCSQSCARRGTRGNAYRDGLAQERQRARRDPRLELWRNEVLTRDHYICRQCGSQEEPHAHHIKLWAESEELRFETDNGLTLCVDCHERLHGRPLWRKRQVPEPVPSR